MLASQSSMSVSSRVSGRPVSETRWRGIELLCHLNHGSLPNQMKRNPQEQLSLLSYQNIGPKMRISMSALSLANCGHGHYSRTPSREKKSVTREEESGWK